MISVFIVAAAPALRTGLRTMLERSDLHVAGEASAIRQAPAIVELAGDTSAGAGTEAAGEAVVVLAGEPVVEDLAAVAELGVAVVALSGDPRLPGLLRRLDLPGWAALPANAGREQLAAAVRAASQGLAAAPVHLASSAAAPAEPADGLQEALTPREREVLQLLSQGLSNKLIARRLTISEHTVKFHISSIYGKLGAVSRTEAVSLAARRGLISL